MLSQHHSEVLEICRQHYDMTHEEVENTRMTAKTKARRERRKNKGQKNQHSCYTAIRHLLALDPVCRSVT